MIRTEREMDPILRRRLNLMGYRVVGELAIGDRRADLAARKIKSNEVRIFEMIAAVHTDRRHLAQAIRWLDYVASVTIVLLSPNADRWIENSTAQIDATIVGALGISLWVIDSATQEIVFIPSPPTRTGPRVTAPAVLEAFDGYEQAGVNPVGGQPGNAGKSHKALRADRVYNELRKRADTTGWATKHPLEQFRPWYDFTSAAGIKRDLQDDPRFKFSKIQSRPHVSLAPEVETVTG